MFAWLIGDGPMALEHARVLHAHRIPFRVVGKEPEKVAAFADRAGDLLDGPPFSGGHRAYLESKPSLPDFAVVAVSEQALHPVALDLLDYGVGRILLEKPAGLDRDEVAAIAESAQQNKAVVRVAYNRRFYGSVRKARELIRDDGGVRSCHFEITEWSHLVRDLDKPDRVKAAWFYVNSTHVTDLAFFLCGEPAQWQGFTGGALDWHPRSAIFTGAGRCASGALFSYHADWGGPGRWSLEVTTASHRFIFRPLERLQIQDIGSVQTRFLELDDNLDQAYKPGLYRQLEAFLRDDPDLCSIDRHLDRMSVYQGMAGY